MELILTKSMIHIIRCYATILINIIMSLVYQEQMKFMIHIIRCYATILINIIMSLVYQEQMIRVVRKPTFGICENKDAD